MPRAQHRGSSGRWVPAGACALLSIAPFPALVSAAPPLDATRVNAPSPEAPSPGEPQTALEWFDRGLELAGREDFEAAAEAFLRSHALQPTTQALLNAAYAFEAAKRPLDAVSSYRLVLAQPELDEGLAAQVREALDAQVATLVTLKGVRYSPDRPLAHLWINGRERDIENFPMLLEPGLVDIEAEDEDGYRGRERVALDPGEVMVVDVARLLPPPVQLPPQDVDAATEGELEGDSPTTSPTSPSRPDQIRDQRHRGVLISTWVGVGLSGALGVGISTTGLLTRREYNLYNDSTCFEEGACAGSDDPNVDPPGDPEAHYQAMTRYEDATNALIGVGVVVGAVTLGLGISAIVLGRKRAAASESVRLAPVPGGLGLRF
ncbi:hypothetical protein [Pseudenhygromyxa sp. WMMC2535]|uniref:tetratricopeptide repeat protein n=1 Tax=Pseudenhygromyxa sp. WMMC2535 TaxID=2712867 RepID=UPI0015553D34|nr:hypothetical protein [Pseudenhygromyxa sp. WMMC2535]